MSADPAWDAVLTAIKGHGVDRVSAVSAGNRRSWTYIQCLCGETFSADDADESLPDEYGMHMVRVATGHNG